MNENFYCQCDYDYDGERYYKTSRYCPIHDHCDWCMTNLGVYVIDKDWVCTSCYIDFEQEKTEVTTSEDFITKT